MNFLRKMKSRELVEMSLKTIIALLVSIILIFLMEGMIYGIYMNKINETKSSTVQIFKETTAYCEEIGDDEYKIYLCTNEEQGNWHVSSVTGTKEEIASKGYKNVVWGKPSPFDVSINGSHYIVMAIFIAAVLGLYGWRFYRLNKEYVAFEKKLKKNGSIF